jgi:hypothetical protein
MIGLIVGGIYFDKVHKKFYQVISVTPEGVLITCPSKFYLDCTLKSIDFIRDNIDHVDNQIRVEVYAKLRKLNSKKLLYIKEYSPLIENSALVIPSKAEIYAEYGVVPTPVSGDLVSTDKKSGTVNFIRRAYKAEIISPTAFLMNQPYHEQLVNFVKHKSMDLDQYSTLIHLHRKP